MRTCGRTLPSRWVALARTRRRPYQRWRPRSKTKTPMYAERRRQLANAGRIGKDAAGATEALVALLKDKDKDVRWGGGPGACRVSARTRRPRSRHSATFSRMTINRSNCMPVVQLVVIEEDPTLHIKALADALTATEVEVRGTAAYILGELGPLAKGALPAMADALKSDKDVDVRRAVAAGGSGEMGTYAQNGGAGAGCGTASRTRTWECRRAAPGAWRLAEIGPDAKEAVPALISAAEQHAKSRCGGSAAHALGEIGPGAKAAIDA